MLWSAAYGHGRRDSGGGVLVQAGGDAMAIDVFWALQVLKVGMNRCRARGNQGDGASVGSNGCHRGIAAGKRGAAGENDRCTAARIRSLYVNLCRNTERADDLIGDGLHVSRSTTGVVDSIFRTPE